MNTELLPCPFCGGAPILENVICEASVICRYCNAKVTQEHSQHSSSDGLYAAIDIWNNRGMQPNQDAKE